MPFRYLLDFLSLKAFSLTSHHMNDAANRILWERVYFRKCSRYSVKALSVLIQRLPRRAGYIKRCNITVPPRADPNDKDYDGYFSTVLSTLPHMPFIDDVRLICSSPDHTSLRPIFQFLETISLKHLQYPLIDDVARFFEIQLSIKSFIQATVMSPMHLQSAYHRYRSSDISELWLDPPTQGRA